MRDKKKRSLAIRSLVGEPTIERAAMAAGCTPEELHKWLLNPGFHDEYVRARRMAYQQCVGVAVRYSPVAVNVLAQIMMDSNAPKTARVVAANSILRVAAELEIEELSRQVDYLHNNT